MDLIKYKDIVIAPIIKMLRLISTRTLLIFFIISILVFFLIIRSYTSFGPSTTQLFRSTDSAYQRWSLMQINKWDFDDPALAAAIYKDDLTKEEIKKVEQMSIPSYMISYYFNVIESTIAYFIPIGYNYFYLQITAFLSYLIPSLFLTFLMYRFGVRGLMVSCFLVIWIWTSKSSLYLFNGYFNNGHLSALIGFFALIFISHKKYYLAIVFSFLAILAKGNILFLPFGMLIYFFFVKEYKKSFIVFTLMVIYLILRTKFYDPASQYKPFDHLMLQFNEGFSVGLNAIWSNLKIFLTNFKIILLYIGIGGWILLFDFRNKKNIIFWISIIGLMLFITLIDWDIHIQSNSLIPVHYEAQFEILMFGAFYIIFKSLFEKSHNSSKQKNIIVFLSFLIVLSRFIMKEANSDLDFVYNLMQQKIFAALRSQKIILELIVIFIALYIISMIRAKHFLSLVFKLISEKFSNIIINNIDKIKILIVNGVLLISFYLVFSVKTETNLLPVFYATLDYFKKFNTEVLPEYKNIPPNVSVAAFPGASIHLENKYRVIIYNIDEQQLVNMQKKYTIIVADIGYTAQYMKQYYKTRDKKTVDYSNIDVQLKTIIEKYPYAYIGKYLCAFSSKYFPGFDKSTLRFFDGSI